MTVGRLERLDGPVELLQVAAGFLTEVPGGQQHQATVGGVRDRRLRLEALVDRIGIVLELVERHVQGKSVTNLGESTILVILDSSLVYEIWCVRAQFATSGRSDK